MGFGTAWLERQVFVDVCGGACGSACLIFRSMASQWRAYICEACADAGFYFLPLHILSCIFGCTVAFPEPELRPAGRPFKLNVSHQSFRELWPLNHCRKSDSCHLLHTHTPAWRHKHTLQQRARTQLHKLNGQAWRPTHAESTDPPANISLQYVCLPTHTRLHTQMHRSTKIHMLSHLAPRLVVISPWYFLGNTLWSSRTPIKKRYKDVGKKIEKQAHSQTSTQTCSHTSEIDISAVTLKCPAISISVPRGTCQTPVVTGSRTVPLLSPARSFMLESGPELSVESIFTCKRASEFCFSN